MKLKLNNFYKWVLMGIMMITLVGCSGEEVEDTLVELDQEEEIVEAFEGLAKKVGEKEEVKEEPKELEGELKVHYINVGQGDATYLEFPDGKNMLVDGGTRSNGHKVIEYLNALGVSKVDAVISTHPHEDHMGGLIQVIKDYDIGGIYLPDKDHTSQVYIEFLEVIDKQGYGINRLEEGEMFTTDEDYEIQILAPNPNITGTSLNDYSVAFRLEYGDTSFMFTGDAEKKAEQYMVDSGLKLESDVLKVGHHGGDTSTIPVFLEKVNPKYSIISAGVDNQYGHPHQNVLERLTSKGVDIYRTDTDGSIIATSNSKTITFNKQPSKENTASSGGTGSEESGEDDESDGGGSGQYVSGDENAEVFGTKTGSKYHRGDCRHVAKSNIGMTVSEAQGKGLEPCGVCHPPQ